LGDFVVTGSHDKSLRRWQRTDEPFFIDEEKEKRLESLFEGAAQDEHRVAPPVHVQAEGVVESSARKTQV
jgi:U3 small nucleolar RNA-associated protein 12